MLTKRRIYEIVEKAEPGDWPSWIFDACILTLIVLNVAALCAETVESVQRAAPRLFRGFEIVSVVVFTLEYVLRLWSVTSSARYAHPVWGRVRFALTLLAVIDLLAVLPFYLPFLGLDLRFVRSLRLFRLMRVAKFTRYSRALHRFARVFAAKKEELTITVSVLVLLLLFSSAMMYWAERDEPDTAFTSIPAAMWWAVATLTTVGYGDVYPTTAVGKIIASVIAVLGIGLFALPTGILGAGFVDELREERTGPRTCPHCGKTIDD